MMQRRHFVLAALAAALGLRFALTTDETSIVAVLRKRLHYLQLDDEGLRAFARDLSSQHTISSSRLRWVGAGGPLYSDLTSNRYGMLADSVRHGEERIVTSYLLSSDFFRNSCDESRTVRYLGYYDPLRGCGNPFARRCA